MHEMKFAKYIVDILEKETSGPDIGEVKTVFIEVGELRYIVPDILVSGFKAVPKKKKLQKADLNIKVLPLKVKCTSCGVLSIADKTDLRCPVCTSGKTELVSGNEITIKGIEW